MYENSVWNTHYSYIIARHIKDEIKIVLLFPCFFGTLYTQFLNVIKKGILASSIYTIKCQL